MGTEFDRRLGDDFSAGFEFVRLKEKCGPLPKQRRPICGFRVVKTSRGSPIEERFDYLPINNGTIDVDHSADFNAGKLTMKPFFAKLDLIVPILQALGKRGRDAEKWVGIPTGAKFDGRSPKVINQRPVGVRGNSRRNGGITVYRS
jgi:hypothetical protein